MYLKKGGGDNGSEQGDCTSINQGRQKGQGSGGHEATQDAGEAVRRYIGALEILHRKFLFTQEIIIYIGTDEQVLTMEIPLCVFYFTQEIYFNFTQAPHR